MITRARANILHSGQIAIGQLSVIALLLAALADSPLAWLAAVPVATGLAGLAFGRWRGRWLSGWLGLGLRYLSRRRTLAPGADPATLLAFVAPGTAVWSPSPPESDYPSAGDPPAASSGALLRDPHGLTAVLVLGEDPPLASAGPVLPEPADLIPTGPPVTVQLLVASVPVTGTGNAAACYRRLTGGALPARQRAVLAVRAQHLDPDIDVHQTLHSALRRIGRRLRDEQLAYRRLDGAELLATVAELAHHEPARAAREGWSGLALGGLGHLSLRVTGLTGSHPPQFGELLPRLLGSTQAVSTIALTATGAATGAATGTELVIRLAAPTSAGLGGAAAAVYGQLAAAGLGAERLDGEQLTGLAATLPLGRPPTATGALTRPAPSATNAWPITGSATTRPTIGTVNPTRQQSPHERQIGRITLPAAGLMLGRDRRGQPVTVQLFGPRARLLMLVGGVPAGQLVVLRALALGTRLVVCTDRPAAWQPFLRAVGRPGAPIALLPAAGPVALPIPDPLHPQLIVVDGGQPPAAAVPWRGTLLLRDTLTPADLDPLAGADLAVLQPLAPDEAALAGAALGLGSAQEWLSRIRADMVAAVGRWPDGHRTVRWTLLCATDLEAQLIDAPQRVAAG